MENKDSFLREGLKYWEDASQEYDYWGVKITDFDGWVAYGVQLEGVVYYVLPTKKLDGVFVFIKMSDNFSEMVNNVLFKVSKPRFDVLKKYCPKLCRAFMDGFAEDSRYDRGALVKIDDTIVLGIQMPFDFKGAIEKNAKVALVDKNITSVLVRLINVCADIEVEGLKFSGFSTMEEIEISAKEVLPGAKMGWNLGRLLQFIGV